MRGGLGVRIGGSFALVCVVLVTMGIVSLVQVQAIRVDSQRIQDVLDPSIQANLRLTAALHASHASLARWGLDQDEVFQRQRRNAWSRIRKAHKQLVNESRLWDDELQRGLLALVGEDLDQLAARQDEVEARARAASPREAAGLLAGDHALLMDRVVSSLRKISDPQRWEMERVFRAQQASEDRHRTTVWIFLCLGGLISVVLGWWLARSVLAPLDRTILLAGMVSRGDYSVGVELGASTDRLGVALRTMTAQLRERELLTSSQHEKLETNNQELEKLNRQLSGANEELSQFSYRTSHDLKAPLATVKGLSRAILEDLEEGRLDDVRHLTERIAAQVDRLAALVEDILDLARADLRDHDVERLDLQELVEEIRASLRQVHPDGEVSVEPQIDPQVVFEGSRVRLTQVLSNLISNGIKYADPRRADRRVRVAVEGLDDGVRIQVSDNGLGIPAEHHAQVFSMFRRFHSDAAAGSGLGLYIVKKHVERMGGSIGFRSSAEGTAFELLLPAVAGDRPVREEE